MKKFLLIAMVMCIAIPALAVDIGFRNNENETGTITYTAAVGEVVRGIALKVTLSSGGLVNEPAGIGATSINPEFNVFMDSAWWEEVNNDGYTIGEGTPLATFDAKGPLNPIALANEFSICMGVIDDTGPPYEQAGASDDGTYDLLTIKVTADTDVTIEVDALRGGIVGDNLASGSIVGGTITMAPAVTYDVTITVEDTAAVTAGCTVTDAPGGLYPSGNTATLTPNAAANWSFSAWSGVNAGELDDQFNGSWELDMNGNKAVTATFLINTYTLTYNTDGNGGIIGSTPQVVNHGSNGSTVTADPAANYEFVDWTPGNDTNPIRQDMNVTGNITVQANFTQIQHTLTVATDGTGTGTVDSPYVLGALLVNQGTLVDVLGTADGGSSFVARDPVGTFTMTTDALVTLTFDEDAVCPGNVTDDDSGYTEVFVPFPEPHIEIGFDIGLWNPPGDTPVVNLVDVQAIILLLKENSWSAVVASFPEAAGANVTDDDSGYTEEFVPFPEPHIEIGFDMGLWNPPGDPAVVNLVDVQALILLLKENAWSYTCP